MTAKLVEECGSEAPGRVYIVRDDGTACMVWSPHWHSPTGWIKADSGPAPKFARPRTLTMVPEAATAKEIRFELERLGLLSRDAPPAETMTAEASLDHFRNTAGMLERILGDLMINSAEARARIVHRYGEGAANYYAERFAAPGLDDQPCLAS